MYELTDTNSHPVHHTTSTTFPNSHNPNHISIPPTPYMLPSPHPTHSPSVMTLSHLDPLHTFPTSPMNANNIPAVNQRLSWRFYMVSHSMMSADRTHTLCTCYTCIDVCMSRDRNPRNSCQVLSNSNLIDLC